MKIDLKIKFDCKLQTQFGRLDLLSSDLRWAIKQYLIGEEIAAPPGDAS